MKINQLSPYIYNRIAAGEVVERPSSVVKELVENSLDAGATNISIYISKGGTEEITVIDNGSGIDSDDLDLVFAPHATSKISDVNDLDRIASYGFRGEALASIASVSNITLKTRTNSTDTGYLCTYNGVKLEKKSITSCNIGTTIVVSNLFYNTPARAKYLKQPKSEEKQITALVTKFVLSNPYIKFNYYIDNNEKIISQGKGLLSALDCVYSNSITRELIKVDYDNNGYSIKGYIGNPNILKSNRSMQTFTVNDRIITNANINVAINKGYGERLFVGTHPVYVINLSMPIEEVDINVTPNKSDARFYNNDFVFSCIYRAINNALKQYDEQKLLNIKNELLATDTFKNEDLSNAMNNSFEQRYVSIETNNIKSNNIINELKNITFDNDGLSESTNIDKIKNYHIEQQLNIENEESLLNSTKSDENDLISNLGTKKYNIIGVVFNTFLLIESYSKKLYFIDIHAACERIKYDKLIAEIDNMKIDVQPMIVPIILELDSAIYDYITSVLDELKALGIDIIPFGGDCIKISSLPSILIDLNINSFINELYKARSEKLSISNSIKHKLATIACKNSIKAGVQLSEYEQKAIAEQIISENMPLQCPHGRPILIEMTESELIRRFKR